MGASLADRRSLAVSTLWTTRKSVVQYPIEMMAPSPKTMPIQWIPMGLSEKEPMLLQRCV